MKALSNSSKLLAYIVPTCQILGSSSGRTPHVVRDRSASEKRKNVSVQRVEGAMEERVLCLGLGVLLALSVRRSVVNPLALARLALARLALARHLWREPLEVEEGRDQRVGKVRENGEENYPVEDEGVVETWWWWWWWWWWGLEPWQREAQRGRRAERTLEVTAITKTVCVPNNDILYLTLWVHIPIRKLLVHRKSDGASLPRRTRAGVAVDARVWARDGVCREGDPRPRARQIPAQGAPHQRSGQGAQGGRHIHRRRGPLRLDDRGRGFGAGAVPRAGRGRLQRLGPAARRQLQLAMHQPRAGA